MNIRPGNYLFVCHANKSRSPYAADLFSNYCKENKIEVKVKSAGVCAYDLDGVQISEDMVDWADFIFVMEEDILEDIVKLSPGSIGKTFDLDIADIFRKRYGEPPFVYNFTNQEALKYYYERERHDPDFEMGPVLFSKVLFGKLEQILGEIK